MASKLKTDWVKTKPEELEKLVVELAKNNIPSEKIGLILRDEHGIPKSKIFGKKICQILEENGIKTNSELNNIAKKIDNLKKHFTTHKHDYSAQRSIVKNTGKLNKLKKIAAK